MNPLQRRTRDLHNDLKISSQLEDAFRTALGELPWVDAGHETFKSPTRGALNQSLSRLALTTLPKVLPTYVAGATLHSIIDMLGVAQPEQAPPAAIHDDMPIAFALRYMEKHQAEIALVATEEGPRYVRYSDLKRFQDDMKSAFCSETGQTISEIFRLDTPLGKYPKRGFNQLYEAATDALCQLQTWYKCQEDGTCIMNRSDCPRDSSHATQSVDSSECCL